MSNTGNQRVRQGPRRSHENFNRGPMHWQPSRLRKSAVRADFDSSKVSLPHANAKHYAPEHSISHWAQPSPVLAVDRMANITAGSDRLVGLGLGSTQIHAMDADSDRSASSTSDAMQSVVLGEPVGVSFGGPIAGATLGVPLGVSDTASVGEPEPVRVPVRRIVEAVGSRVVFAAGGFCSCMPLGGDGASPDSTQDDGGIGVQSPAAPVHTETVSNLAGRRDRRLRMDLTREKRPVSPSVSFSEPTASDAAAPRTTFSLRAETPE